MIIEYTNAAHQRDLVAYRALGMLECLIEFGHVPPHQTERANAIIKDFKAADAAMRESRQPEAEDTRR